MHSTKVALRWALILGGVGAFLSMKRPNIELVPLLAGTGIGAVVGYPLGLLLAWGSPNARTSRSDRRAHRTCGIH